jgi:hypothetical protein
MLSPHIQATKTRLLFDFVTVVHADKEIHRASDALEHLA